MEKYNKDKIDKIAKQLRDVLASRGNDKCQGFVLVVMEANDSGSWMLCSCEGNKHLIMDGLSCIINSYDDDARTVGDLFRDAIEIAAVNRIEVNKEK